eukprot:899661-Prymnesium_polylepis.2
MPHRRARRWQARLGLPRAGGPAVGALVLRLERGVQLRVDAVDGAPLRLESVVLSAQLREGALQLHHLFRALRALIRAGLIRARLVRARLVIARVAIARA